MLTTGHVNMALYPKSPKSLKSNWHLSIPQLADPIEVIEVDDRFLISLGAHDAHRFYLFSVQRKPSVDELCLVESAVSFCFDCPCALTDPVFENDATELYRGFKRYYKKFHGKVADDFYRPFTGIEQITETASEHGLDSYQRYLQCVTPGDLRWKLVLPTQERVKNALFMYRLACMSLDPFSRILNYWRCLESLTTVADRRMLFANLPNLGLAPVMVRDWMEHGDRGFDVMKRYVGEARLHFNHLTKKGHSPSDICDYYYSQRRCPVAHAERDPLYFGSGVSLGELMRDCILLKVVVRSAIESKL